MGKKFLIILLALVCGRAMGQASEYGIDIFPRQFSAIELKGNVKCIISTADTSNSTITLYGISQKDVHWRVRNNTLYVSVPSGILDRKGYALVRVNQPTLSKIAIGGAQVESDGVIKGTSLAVETLGSINRMLIKVDVNSLNVVCSGDSDIAISGRSSSSNLSASLGSRIDCLSCSADSVRAQCNSNSEIYVRASKYINGKALFGGTIYFTGDAAIEPKLAMWGDLIPIEDNGAMESFKLFESDASKLQPTKIVAPAEKATKPAANSEKTTKAAKPDKAAQPAKSKKSVEKSVEQSEKREVLQDENDFF